ncbi:MAG: MoxR family ATPase [Firmicutes bacterium]|nr:MoxR family ATPase [Bacillota bacterium]
MRQALHEVQKAIVGKPRAVKAAFVALLAQGHTLIEDRPGLGKTTLVRAVAQSLGCQFRRIQFTPDLLPSDITGVHVLEGSTGSFRFRPGPIFGQVVLADEINRASPKTQSSLLEAMEERQVTVEGTTYPLPEPFAVMATQNPIEYEGTFSLPEAQLDRFMLRIVLGYPTFAEEREILRRQEKSRPLDEVRPVATAAELLQAQKEIRAVHLCDLVADYIISLTTRTRSHPEVYLGASPRATLALERAAKALAYLSGRDYVLPDDVKDMAGAVLSHRIIPSPEGLMKGTGGEEIVSEILKNTPVPVV